MSVSTTAQMPAHVPAQPGHVVPEPSDEPALSWWEGIWFEGALDPRGTLFAVALALAATAALLVVVTAAVRIATGA